eukprot:COSAG01_NODE_31533_length_595_cov_2789.383065_1_plen_59_part_01
MDGLCAWFSYPPSKLKSELRLALLSARILQLYFNKMFGNKVFKSKLLAGCLLLASSSSQ